MPPSDNAPPSTTGTVVVSLNEVNVTSSSNRSSTVRGESVNTYVTLVLPSKFMFPRMVKASSGPRIMAARSTNTLPYTRLPRWRGALSRL